VSNGAGTDYVFYQDQNGNLVRVVSEGQQFINEQPVVSIDPGAKLSAVYNSSSSAAVVYYKRTVRIAR